MPEALIFPSTNSQYDNRLFIKLQVQYMEIPSSEHGEKLLCTEIVFYIQNNFCTQHVLPMFCKKKSFWQRFTCTRLPKKKLFQIQGVPDCLKCMGLKNEANHLRENYWKLEKLLESEMNFKISVLSFCCAWLHYKMSCS